ncbi:MAG: hypothetical protein ABR581_04100 [Thermoleophilaceae bacterium]
MNELVLVQGWSDTRATLERWRHAPGRLLAPWLVRSLQIACALLFAVYVVARLSAPDASRLVIPGYTTKAGVGDYLHILYRNSLVLALHAMACVAGFIAGSSLPISASHRSGVSRWVHEKAGPLAIGFVICATAFSLCTQAYAIGGAASTVAAQLGVGPATLILTLLPHALPELIALFLPLAAWIAASRRGDWDELLAATFVTAAVAVPMLLASAAIELGLWPLLLRAAAG